MSEKFEDHYRTGDLSLDLAYDIIAMARKIERLEGELAHAQSLNDIHVERMENSDNHTKEMTGIILSAVLDPDSALNRGHAALVREEVGGEEDS